MHTPLIEAGALGMAGAESEKLALVDVLREQHVDGQALGVV